MFASRLDVDKNSKICRLAFYGRQLFGWPECHNDVPLSVLRLYNEHQRFGRIEKKISSYAIIASGMFKNNFAVEAFVKMKVDLDNGQTGVIDRPFEKDGKLVLSLSEKLNAEEPQSVQCSLKYKKYFFVNKALRKKFQK
ncbi:hypothetical protein ACOME3_003729 [Neoechinorhynchus agilis]